MKRKRILTQFWLYFLMLMLLLAAGCSSSNDNNTPAPVKQAKLVTISGTVTTAGGIPVSGVVMSAMINLEVMNISLFEGSFDSDKFSIVITKADGTYSLTVPAALIENYTLILTPAKNGYAFAPTERSIQVGLADIPDQNFTATAVTEFSQSDLTGTTWRINLLRTGTENKWLRARIKIVDSSGTATCLSMSDSNNPPTTDLCPVAPATFNLKFTVGSDGVITQSGADAFGNNDNMTMNSAKNLMAGTAGYGTSYQLMIAQKDTVSTTATALTSLYQPGYVQGANFVFHSLSVGRAAYGGKNEWRYGAGATTTGGVISILDEFDPAGAATHPLAGTTMSLDYTGVVTIADAGGKGNDFVGFLSQDLHTIVGTYSAPLASPLLPPDCKLVVIQINDDQTTNEMTGSSVNHLLAVNEAGNAMFWGYHDVDISRIGGSLVPDILNLSVFLNIMLSYNWELSTSLTDIQKLAMINLEKINISNNGEAIIKTIGTSSTPSVITFHGQLGCDGTFMVGVRTKTMPVEGVDVDFYTLNVITH